MLYTVLLHLCMGFFHNRIMLDIYAVIKYKVSARYVMFSIQIEYPCLIWPVMKCFYLSGKSTKGISPFSPGGTYPVLGRL